MTTERLYYNDSYTLEFEAHVSERTNHKDRPALVLDRTYFYPEGGGQPADQGAINGVKVVDVQTRPDDRAVLHVLEKPLNDARIEAQIDKTRRFDLMQHHSGQHVLSKALEVAARASTLSVHMSTESMTIDVNRADITAEEWAAVEELANQVVLQDLPVRAWFPAPEELAILPVRKMPDVAGKVRIVDVGGFDITACGGTHVARSGEIGTIKVIKADRRGDTTRLEFRCGVRALRDYREKNAIINRLSAEMTVGYWELIEAVNRIQNENKSLRSELKAAKSQLAKAEAASLITGAGEGRIVVRAFGDRSVDEVRALVTQITAAPGMVALLGAAGDKAQVIMGRAEDVALDVVPLLKSALKTLGSDRGGGRPNFAQGGGIPAALNTLESALAAAADEARRLLGR